MDKKLTVGILGVGEVGSSILSLVREKHKALIREIDEDSIKDQKLDVLHVCIPYSENFERIVVENMKRNNPDLTIVESTVPIKTIENIFQVVKKPIAHSPVRGFHSTMVEDLRKFIKFIGAPDPKFAAKTKSYYRSLGVNAQILSSSRATEMGKLLDTTYYALCIAWHQEMERFCKKYNVDFDEAVTSFNKTYNDGYRVSKPHVVRPVLTPGIIGGHCLIPNIDLLKKSVESPFLKVIEQSNDKKKKGV